MRNPICAFVALLTAFVQPSGAEEVSRDVTQRYTSGETEMVTTFRLEGGRRLKVKEETYYVTRQKKIAVEYQNGVIHGALTGWDESDRQVFQSTYADGKKSGPARAWYPNGNFREVSDWAEGRRHGTTILWDIDGDSFVSVWQNGKIQSGDFVFQWTNRTKSIDESGKLVWAGGRKEIVQSYAGGEVVKAMSWDDAGRKKNETGYLNGKPNGAVKQWNSNGVMTGLSTYSAGLLEGPTLQWRHTGETSSVTHYSRGKKHGPALRWYRTGEPHSAAHYSQGQLHDTVIHWYRSGVKHSESAWDNGKPVQRPRRWNETSKPIEDAQSASFTSEEFNLKIEKPKKPWMKIDPKEINAEALLVYFLPDPMMTFILFAEDVGVHVMPEAGKFADVILENIPSKGEGYKLLKKYAYSQNALTGIRAEYELKDSRGRIFTITWFVTHRGFAYRLYVAGSSSDKTEIQKEFDRFALNFQILDPERESDKSPENLLKQHVSRAFDYSIASLKEPWLRSRDIEGKYPASDLGLVAFRHPAVFIVSGADLGDFAVDFEDLTASFLGMLGKKYPGPEFKNPKPVPIDGGQGVEYEFESPLGEKPGVYRVEIARKGRFGYMAAAMSHQEWAQEAKPAIDEVFSSIQFGSVLSKDATPDLSIEQQRANCLVLNDLGVRHYNAKKIKSALSLFLKALESNPDDGAVLSNASNAYIDMRRYEEALAMLDTHLPRFRDAWEIHKTRAFVLAMLKRWEEAESAYREAADHLPLDEKLSMDYASVLWEVGKKDRALRIIKDLMKKTGSVSSALFLARLHRDNKDFKAAAEILENTRSEYPKNTDILIELVETEIMAGNHGRALEWSQKLIEIDPASPTGHLLKGRSEMILKRYRDAKESLEKSYQLNPYDAGVKELLSVVSSLMGQGDQTALKKPIDPVKFAAQFSIEEQVRQKPDASYVENHDAYEILNVKAYEYEHGKTSKWTVRWIIKIVNAEGVGQFGELTYDFDPLYQQMYVNHLIVYDAQGRKAAEGGVDRYYTVDRKGDVASQDKEAHLPVPGLMPGTIIDFMATVRNHSSEKFLFDRHYMIGTMPILEKYFAVSGDIAKLVHTHQGVDDAQIGNQALVFRKSRPAVLHLEEFLPPLYEILPAVSVASRSTWVEEVNQYRKQLTEFYSVEDEIKALARGLTESCDTVSCRIETLSRFVRDSLHYKAIAFGPRARIPNKVIKTLREKYGDCKDFSIMLHGLLQSVGVKSYPVLVHTSEPIDTGIPTLDQFNHMIVAAEDESRLRFIDCTEKYQSEQYSPLWLGGKQALPIIENADQFHTLAESTGTGVLRIERAVAFDTDWQLAVSETVHMGGYVRDLMRASLASIKKAEWQDKLGMFLGKWSGDFTMRDLSVNGFESADTDLIIRTEYALSHRFIASSNQVVGRLPATWEQNYLSISKPARRHHPFRSTRMLEVTSDVTVHIPEDFELKNSEILTRKSSDHPHIRWDSEGRTDGHQIQLFGSCRISKVRGEAKEYDAYRIKLEEGANLMAEKMILKKK